ncbi:hypothetical protein KR044_009333, partial [Drosophila immigrans]
MEGLNDDCQLAIIKYLNLTDQIALYEATRGVSNRLTNSIVSAWKHQLYFTVDGHIYEKFKKNPEMLDIFLSSISGTVQELKLLSVSVDFLKRWKNYTFPSMKTLEYTLDEWEVDNWRNDPCNEAVEILTKLFPGLHSVKPHGCFDNHELSKWTQLRKLDLAVYWPCARWLVEMSSAVTDDWPNEIIDCQLLEELRLYRGCWNYVYDEVMALPRLSTLSFFLNLKMDIYYLSGVLEPRVNDIDKIVFNDFIWLSSMYPLRILSNLRHLVLARVRFTTEDLLEEITNLKKLEQLDLIDFISWSDATELWQMVAHCPSLKILNISGIKMHKGFFEFDQRVMKETLDNRSHPFTLHCHDPG